MANKNEKKKHLNRVNFTACWCLFDDFYHAPQTDSNREPCSELVLKKISNIVLILYKKFRYIESLNLYLYVIRVLSYGLYRLTY